MSYEYLEDVAIADVAFEAEALELPELFADCGKAVANTQVKDLSTVEPKVSKDIEVKAGNVEDLLHEFLEELVFLKDTEQLLLSEFRIKIEKKDGAYELTCLAQGEEIDTEKHETLVEVKSITWHLFEVKKKDGKWTARVVLDV